MKKAQKEQAENIIRLLGNVHDGIKKAVERGRYDSARDLLSQCQESAIELGETIEAIEGEGFVTVSCLEHYCEAVYQAYILLSQPAGVNASRVYKSLRRALIPAENSVKNDIRIRREAVFLPYKASMWDSLESVWKAADEDPDCDAYVIPIPYYDKNPDGSFREMHYEGDQYPEYVPVTWYEDYDFAERQPDMIFIHNPYDECNYVTSVHPFFYAGNLKQFTEKLVYIPYFIIGEPDLENEESIKGMAHFCTVPGVIYADKVIVQSEAMRQVYIRVMVEFTAKGREVDAEANRKYWEEKILGLGSPKVDKVLSTKKEELDIPKEWLRVIEKPDGSWKKIIFYNTSVTALLEHGEKMLTKMRDVFLVFEKNKDEVALLWRPHPLIKATIESMRPELWEEYEGIVREYKDAGWGIYDDSAELDRAIEVSDAYYGDNSSLVNLCQKANMPVIIQNTELRETERKTHHTCVLSLGAYTDGIEFWLPSREINALFYMDTESNQMKFLTDFPHCQKPGAWEIADGIAYKNKILFFSKRAYQVWVFDTQTKEIRDYIYCNNKVDIITNIKKVGEEIWIFSNSFKIPILCLDLLTRNILTVNWEEYTEKNSDESSFTKAVKQGEKLYFATRKTNQIYLCIIHCTQKKITYKKIVTLHSINCLQVKDNKLWLLGKNHYYQTVLQRYDIDAWEQETEIEMKEAKKIGERILLNYFQMVVFENKIFLLPACAKTIIVYDMVTGEERKLQYPSAFDHSNFDREEIIFGQAKQIEEQLYLYPYCTGQILNLNMRTLTLETVNQTMDEIELQERYRKALYAKDPMQLYENPNVRWNLLIGERTKSHVFFNKETEKNSGASIYRYLSE